MNRGTGAADAGGMSGLSVDTTLDPALQTSGFASGPDSPRMPPPPMPPDPAVAPPRQVGLLVGLVALLVVLCAGGWYVYRSFLSTPKGPTIAMPTPGSVTAPPPASELPKDASTPSPPLVSAPPATIDETKGATPADAGRDGAKAGSAGFDDRSAAKDAAAEAGKETLKDTGKAPKGKGAPATKDKAGAIPTPVPVVPPAAKAPVAAPTRPAPPAPVPVKEAARPDRWQQMDEAVAACGKESLLSRLICEQRVRNQYCSGYWGTVRQCPNAPANDRGQ